MRKPPPRRRCGRSSGSSAIPSLQQPQRLQAEGRLQRLTRNRAVLGADHGLAHRAPSGVGDRQRPRTGAHPRDHLEQRHQRRRVEEVHSHDALRVARASSDPGHRQRGGVGSEHAVLADDVREPPVELALELEALGRRLDHELARRERGELGCDLQTRGCLLGLLGRDLALGSFFLQTGADALGALLQRRGIGSCSSVARPRGRRAVRCPRPSCPRRAPMIAGAGWRRRSPAVRQRSSQEGTSALIPVSERPMISFWICEVPS